MDTNKSLYKMDGYEAELEKMAEAGEFIEIEVNKGFRELLKQSATQYFKAKLRLASSSRV